MPTWRAISADANVAKLAHLVGLGPGSMRRQPPRGTGIAPPWNALSACLEFLVQLRGRDNGLGIPALKASPLPNYVANGTKQTFSCADECPLLQ